MRVPRWNCFCGATGNAGQFCPWCGRRDPGIEPPPLPAPATPPAAPAAAPAAAPGDDVADPFLRAPPPPPPAYVPWAQAPARLQWGGPDQAPAAHRVGVTPVTRALAAVLVVLLGVGAVTADRRSEDRRAVAAIAPDGRSLEDVVAAAKRFVADYRGAPFLAEVKVELLDGEEFEDALSAGDEGDPDADAAPHEEDFEATLQGLQLADPDDDLEDEEDALVAAGVVGFYDDETDRLVVRAGELDALAEMTIVHELVHAWQDQHYDLSAMWDEVGSRDEALALRSLVEGDANRTEYAWYESRPGEVQSRIDDLEEEAFDDPGPRTRGGQVLGALYSFPYSVGETFVDAIAQEGGNDALHDAFEDPPVSTSQILHPRKYLEGDVPNDAIDPVPGGPVVDRGTLGEVGLIMAVARGDLREVDFEVTAGWDGDEYVTWTSAGRTCTTVSVVVNDVARRDELVEALRARPLGPGGRVEKRNDGLLFVSCEA